VEGWNVSAAASTPPRGGEWRGGGVDRLSSSFHSTEGRGTVSYSAEGRGTVSYSAEGWGTVSYSAQGRGTVSYYAEGGGPSQQQLVLD